MAPEAIQHCGPLGRVLINKFFRFLPYIFTPNFTTENLLISHAANINSYISRITKEWRKLYYCLLLAIKKELQSEKNCVRFENVKGFSQLV